MMQYALLMLVILLVSGQSVASKQYNVSVEKPKAFIYAGTSAFFAMVFFAVSAGFRLEYSPDYLPYSLGFGISYAASTIGMFYSLRWGSMAVAGLAGSYSLLVPAFYGIFALNEKMSVPGIFGLVLLVISVLLICDTKGKIKFSLKWAVALAVVFFGNGMCSAVQKMQQLACQGAYKNEFMIVALAMVVVICGIMALVNRENPRERAGICLGLGAVQGTMNGMSNLLVMMLTGMMAGTILYPSISAGQIVVTFVLALAVYKEKFTPRQLIGYIFGTVSVILLNI